MRKIIRRAGLAGLGLGALVAAIPMPTASGQTSSQFWPEVDVYWSPSPHWRLFGLGRLQTQPADDDRVTFGAHVDYLGMHYAAWRVAYRYIFPPNGGAAENRGIAELTLTGSGLGLTLANRLRYEVRATEGKVSTRLRERIRLEHLVGPAKLLHVKPFVSGEVAHDSEFAFADCSRVRYIAGVLIASSSPYSVELSYVRQNEWQGSGGDVNAIAMKVILTY